MIKISARQFWFRDRLKVKDLHQGIVESENTAEK